LEWRQDGNGVCEGRVWHRQSGEGPVEGLRKDTRNVALLVDSLSFFIRVGGFKLYVLATDGADRIACSRNMRHRELPSKLAPGKVIFWLSYRMYSIDHSHKNNFASKATAFRRR
jgi:hypothetical protein